MLCLRFFLFICHQYTVLYFMGHVVTHRYDWMITWNFLLAHSVIFSNILKIRKITASVCIIWNKPFRGWIYNNKCKCDYFHSQHIKLLGNQHSLLPPSPPQSSLPFLFINAWIKMLLHSGSLLCFLSLVFECEKNKPLLTAVFASRFSPKRWEFFKSAVTNFLGKKWLICWTAVIMLSSH